MPVRHVVVAVMLAAGPFVVGASLVLADGVGDPTAVKHDDGRYYDKEGNPTFKVQSDGTVDWGTYSGFRRYHSDCHVCHGPDAEGSSYAPALSNYLKTKNYVVLFSAIAPSGPDALFFAGDLGQPDPLISVHADFKAEIAAVRSFRLQRTGRLRRPAIAEKLSWTTREV